MPAVFESLFEFLFKYKPFVFAKGELVLAATAVTMAAAGLLLVIAIPIVRQYRGLGGKSTHRNRVALAVLRAGIVALGCLVLLGPSLVVATAVPQQNFVGVLIDGSRSMRVSEGGAQTRAEHVSEWLDPAGAALLAQLEERFRLRLFKFSDVARRLDDVRELRSAVFNNPLSATKY